MSACSLTGLLFSGLKASRMLFAGSDSSWPSTRQGSLSYLDASLSVSTQFQVWLGYYRISGLGYPLPILDTTLLLMQSETVTNLAVTPATQFTKYTNNKSLAGRNLHKLHSLGENLNLLKFEEIHSSSGPLSSLIAV